MTAWALCQHGNAVGTCSRCQTISVPLWKATVAPGQRLLEYQRALATRLARGAIK